MSKTIIKSTLKEDQSSRSKKNRKNILLHLLGSIKNTNEYDYSLPTIVADKSNYIKSRMITDTKQFKKEFESKYNKYLLGFNYKNVLIAGGIVSSVLCQESYGNDIDMFVYGLKRLEDADNKVKEILTNVYTAYTQSIAKLNLDNKTKLEATVINIRNKNCITVNFSDGGKIQIVLRFYETVQEVLTGFDLGSSAVGYDGEKVYFTSLGKLSHEYMINVVDPSRRSTTYEQRLLKYHSRGFAIVLPHLDITKLRTDYFKYNLLEVAELPYFTFSYKSLVGNKIHLVSLLTKKDSCKDKSDYQSNEYDEYNMFYLNLKNLVSNNDNYYYYSANMNFDILTNSPHITNSRIIDYYDELVTKIYHSCIFNIKAFTLYFPKEALLSVVEELYINKNVEELHNMIEEQKQTILERWNKTKDTNHEELPWIQLDPSAQLSGSFNPIVSDPVDWYGVYYKK